MCVDSVEAMCALDSVVAMSALVVRRGPYNVCALLYRTRRAVERRAPLMR